MDTPQINVLVADDSKVACLLLVHLLEQDPRIRVLGVVNDGAAALEFVARQKPDVILMDLLMPGIDGFETTRRIMETQPVPIIICTGMTDTKEVAFSFKSLEAGAVACIEKPVSRDHPNFEVLSSHLLQTVRLMSEVKVIRRWPRSRSAGAARPAVRPEPPAASGFACVGVGASTGGPPVLQTILAGLPKDFPVPVLIVQHIAHGFLPGLAEWLSQTTGWQIHIAAHGMVPLPGHAYLAPDDFHMGVVPSGRIALSREEAMGGLRPAVAHLFSSLAEVCGSHAIGVLLTGMGRDGAAELKMMRDTGAETIAQSKESSVVHGMPGEAIALGAASHILPAEKIADALITLVRRPAITKGNSL